MMDLIHLGQIESGSNSPFIIMGASGKETPTISFLSTLLSLLLAPDSQTAVVKSQESNPEKETGSDNLSLTDISSVPIATGFQTSFQLDDLSCFSPATQQCERAGAKSSVFTLQPSAILSPWLSAQQQNDNAKVIGAGQQGNSTAVGTKGHQPVFNSSALKKLPDYRPEGGSQIPCQETELNFLDSKNPEGIQTPEDPVIKEIINHASSSANRISKGDKDIHIFHDNSRDSGTKAETVTVASSETINPEDAVSKTDTSARRQFIIVNAIKREKENPVHSYDGFKVLEVKDNTLQEQSSLLTSVKEIRVIESDIESERPPVTSPISQIEKMPEIAESTDAMLRVTVEHDEIGKLDISLVLNKGLINGLIKTPEISTAELLARSLPAIIDSLMKDGLNIGNVSVMIRDNGGGSREDLNPDRSYRRKEAINLNPPQTLPDGSEGLSGDNYINIFV